MILPSSFSITSAASSLIVILNTQFYVAIDEPKCEKTRPRSYQTQDKGVTAVATFCLGDSDEAGETTNRLGD